LLVYSNLIRVRAFFTILLYVSQPEFISSASISQFTHVWSQWYNIVKKTLTGCIKQREYCSRKKLILLNGTLTSILRCNSNTPYCWHCLRLPVDGFRVELNYFLYLLISARNDPAYIVQRPPYSWFFLPFLPTKVWREGPREIPNHPDLVRK
jgi:hypothetical protein